jgi:rhamnogalacturonyl hydrolase YesR
MFAYAFARGVRFGWLSADERGRFAQAALRAWEGLTRTAIDRQGNVHGVCSGSRYSFTADYYMHDLRTVVNDNHGIGIMMLVGCEIVRLQEWLENAPL